MGTGRLIGRNFWASVCSDCRVKGRLWFLRGEKRRSMALGDTIAFGSKWSIRTHGECLRDMGPVRSTLQKLVFQSDRPMFGDLRMSANLPGANDYITIYGNAIHKCHDPRARL